MNNKCQIIGITSGKGGVGKTFFSVNMAISAAKSGKKVLIIDADLGLANVHIMAGIYPEHDLLDFIDGKAELKDIIAEGPEGIHIIPGASGIFKLTTLTHAKRYQLIQQLVAIEKEYDLIIIDTEAGISHNVLRFLNIADKVIVLTTPDLTALADAYAIIKVIHTKKIHKNINLIVNRVRSKAEGELIYSRINNATEKFLNLSVNKLGFIVEDHNTLKDSIKNRKPVVTYYNKTKVASNITEITDDVLQIQKVSMPEQQTNGNNNVVLNRFSMLLNNIKIKESTKVESEVNAN